MTDPKHKKPTFRPIDTNPIEQLKDVGVAAISDVAQLPKDIFETALEQFDLQPQRKPLSGEINLRTGIQKNNQEQITPEMTDGRKVQQLRSLQHQEKEVFNVQK